MLQQIHKGLSATHDREMQPLSAGELSRPPVKGLHEMTPTEIAPPLEKIWKRANELILLTLTDPRGGGFFKTDDGTNRTRDNVQLGGNFQGGDICRGYFRPPK